MKLGLIGTQFAGKTTIFNALTVNPGHLAPQRKMQLTLNRIFIPVSDTRIDKLTELYHPRKTTYASLELVDFPSFFEKKADNSESAGELQHQLRTMDGLAIILRNYQDDMLGPVQPITDLETIEAELMLQDLISVENRLNRIEWARQRGKKTAEMDREAKLLQLLSEKLNNSVPIRDLDLSADEQKMLRGFQLLSQKPAMLVLNSDETNFGNSAGLIEQLNLKAHTVEFAGKFEMELTLFDDQEEARLFMSDMGITSSARERLTQIAFKTLGLISFFTVGADEVRAWTIHRGDTALEAARTIHSDLARGFIRASCFSWEDLDRFGSEKRVRENGLSRLEGKDFVVPDGTIMEIKFNV